MIMQLSTKKILTKIKLILNLAVLMATSTAETNRHSTGNTGARIMMKVQT